MSEAWVVVSGVTLETQHTCMSIPRFLLKTQGEFEKLKGKRASSCSV